MPVYYNPYLMNPNFRNNMMRIVNRKKLQYANIEEFEDSDESEEKEMKPEQESAK